MPTELQRQGPSAASLRLQKLRRLRISGRAQGSSAPLNLLYVLQQISVKTLVQVCAV